MRIALSIVSILIVAGCQQHAAVPVKPANVPTSAVWAGGVDGGAFIDCTPSSTTAANACTVYDDSTGEVWMSGRFTLQGQNRGARMEELKFDGADGARIFLQNNMILYPQPPERPTSVPATAYLGENGVYVNCRSNGPDVYQCEQYLASNGQGFFTGTYLCDKSLSVPCTNLTPKFADREGIYLRNAGALKLVKK